MRQRPFLHAKIVTVLRAGVITIPADVRRRVGIRAGDRVSFELTSDGFVAKKIGSR
jgi:AbrB family looped-hinge helix DNA binding protein